MKKFVKITALVLVIATFACLLASCGGLSGTYSAEMFGTGVEMEFKGNKVYYTIKAVGFSSEPIEGKYSIKGDKIKFEFNADKIENETIKEAVEEMEAEASFEKGDDYIKIDGVKFTKKDK